MNEWVSISMNERDFCYIWRGQQLEPLPKNQVKLLKPVDIRTPGRHRALLMLHGFSSTPAVFRAMIPGISGYDAIVCPALPGHADSLLSFSKTKATDWLNCAEQTCAQLMEEYAAVDVVGLSLGGALACHLAQQFELNRLCLLAPALNLKLPITSALCLARLLYTVGFRTIRNRAGNLHTNQYLELAYRQVPIHAIIEVLTFIQQIQINSWSCPTDVFLGCYDEVVDSQRIAKRFEHRKDVNVHWLKHSAHVLPLDGDRETIINQINGYIDPALPQSVNSNLSNPEQSRSQP